MTIRILTLCTGNICRSPLAAQLLSTGLPAAQFQVASAGTSPVLGERMQDTMERIAERMGISNVPTHYATGLDQDSLAAADLLLGMDRGHRRAAARLVPSAARRSFTLLEFAHIVSFIDKGCIESLVETNDNCPLDVLEVVMRMRGVVPRLRPDRRYDVADPYGRSIQVYERSAKQIERAVDQIVRFFHHTAALTGLTTGYNAALNTQDSERTRNDLRE